MKSWNKQNLHGEWEISIKIDGVKGICKDGLWLSRAGKPLYNLPDMPDGEYEICANGNFKDTISLVRTKSSLKLNFSIFRLNPISQDLLIGVYDNPSKERIETLFKTYRDYGFEGLVLRQGDTLLKVKSEETYDVPITGFIEGKGKFLGTLGALETPMGKVGTGFTNEERKLLWNSQEVMLNSIVEVSCMEITEKGKFRHPRFVRLRPDKER